MSASMPPDPFLSEETGGLAMGIVQEAELLWPALNEARRRSSLYEAVMALGENDLRTLVFEVVLRDAFRRERFGGEGDG